MIGRMLAAVLRVPRVACGIVPRRRGLATMLVLASAASIGGCGYKGDLVLPDRATESKAAAAPAAAAPRPESERDAAAGTDAVEQGALGAGADEGAQDGFEQAVPDPDRPE